MRKPLHFFAILIGVLLFAGCQKSEDPVADPAADPAVNPGESNNQVSTKGFLLRFDNDSLKYEIQELDLSTGSLKLIGTMAVQHRADGYNLAQINYDEQNNQLAGIYNRTNVWTFDLAKKTYKTVALPQLAYGYAYQDLITTKDKTLVLRWNPEKLVLELHEVDLSNGSLKLTGASSNGFLSSGIDLQQLNYDRQHNKLVGLLKEEVLWSDQVIWRIWIYDLASKTDKVVVIPTPQKTMDFYRDAVPAGEKTYVFKWNDTSRIYEIYEANLSNGSLQLIGASKENTIVSYGFVEEFHYDHKYNKIVALDGNSFLWTYDLTKKAEKRVNYPIEFPRMPVFKDLVIPANQ